MRNPRKGNLFLAACFLTASLGSVAILTHVKQMFMIDGGLSFMEGLLLGLGAIEAVFLSLFSGCFLAKHNVEKRRPDWTF